MSGTIEIDDMPDLGSVTDATKFVGEKAGSGLFTASALRDYVFHSGYFTVQISVPGYVAVRAASASDNPAFFLLDEFSSTKAQFSWDRTTNSVQMINNVSTPVGHLTLTPGGDFLYGGSGNAYKAGGGSWTAVSDARIKTVEGDYTPGLAELLQLRPVTYRYRPNCGITATATSYVGLIAQEVAPVLPDMVHTTNGIIDGQPVTDLMALDVNELQYVLLNAIRELSARVEALEAAAA
jgi:hypothetical protein